jgi:hypothetical protein
MERFSSAERGRSPGFAQPVAPNCRFQVAPDEVQLDDGPRVGGFPYGLLGKALMTGPDLRPRLNSTNNDRRPGQGATIANLARIAGVVVGWQHERSREVRGRGGAFGLWCGSTR